MPRERITIARLTGCLGSGSRLFCITRDIARATVAACLAQALKAATGGA
ncbi:hypothetical protein [uncultured Thiohalocapsa sp.]|nr:hypothetical protein [uncultured Thiohalocapsa sp.]